MAHNKPHLCNCPSDASLARVRALRRRLRLAAWWSGSALLRLTAQDAFVLERKMDLRRGHCRWHNPGLRSLYLDPTPPGKS